MIKCGRILLYDKQKNNIRISIYFYKSRKISTYWNSTKLVGKKCRDKNKQILHMLKINGCAICGYNKCDTALSFHHTNPKDKKYTINKGVVKREDIKEELNKCILLCSNCHRELHSKERKII